MRVLAALHLYSPHHNAGAETMAHAMLRALVDRGHQVAVQLSMPHPMHHVEPYVYEGVSVRPYRRADDLWRWCTTPELVPDVIVTHLDTALQATMLSQLTGIPVVQVVHNTHIETKWMVSRRPALAVYNTRWMAADYKQWAAERDIMLPPAIVVHPPIDPQAYRVAPGPVRESRITLINLTEAKGARVFYELARRLPKMRFLGVRGAYGEQIIREDLPNVEIIPHVAAHDMPELVYSRTRILLTPSVYESYGRVAVEAACSGIPTIAHPTPGLLEALGEGGNFADRGDLDAWETLIRRLSTPRNWAQAAQRAAAVPAALDTAADLARWAAAIESVASAHPVPALV